MAKLLSLLTLLSHGVVLSAQELESFTPRCVAETFKPPTVPGATVLSISVEEKHNVSTAPFLPSIPPVSGLNFCEVKVYLTHPGPGSEDKVLVETWLPLHMDDWNGRFQATGGGGWATGFFGINLGPALQAGYVASSTDGGHQAPPGDASWAINTDGSVNWHLLENLAFRSPADQVFVGKSIAEQYFGMAPHHSYWNGCSQGGRQGYVVAQKYPDLLSGIYAVAPALDFINLAMGAFWPQLVMNEAGTLMSQCEFSAFQIKAIEECDILDGVRDGIIEDPELCTFDPAVLIGETIHCDGDEVEITSTMASIARKISEGPRTPFGHDIWYGYPPGTSTDWVANITVGAGGLRSPKPFGVSSSFLNLLLKDSSFNHSKLSYTEYVSLWAQANEEYGWLLNSANYNFQSFRDAGGKILTWHGLADEVVPVRNTIKHRERVEAEMGDTKSVNEFYRLFLAPGVQHCGNGVGPVPKDALAALVEWVEEGESPERLEAEIYTTGGDRITRDLCLYPKRGKYMGIADGFRASSWECEGGDDEELVDEQLEEEHDFLGGLKDRLVQVGLGMGLSIG